MPRRISVYVKEFQHKNPIPNACRIGNLLMTGVINGVDPATGKVPPTLDEQCVFLFDMMRRIVEAGGGTTDDIIKMTVWMQDPSQRQPLNREWVKMFPDDATRPTRHTMQRNMEGATLIQCDFTAVIDPK
ncbi:MAG TPA: Rid family hydrolase [Thermodesulfobacteriota bacterium]|nr:Rid family hydrolase [Thermodesulfobacteriota bacterium]